MHPASRHTVPAPYRRRTCSYAPAAPTPTHPRCPTQHRCSHPHSPAAPSPMHLRKHIRSTLAGTLAHTHAKAPALLRSSTRANASTCCDRPRRAPSLHSPLELGWVETFRRRVGFCAVCDAAAPPELHRAQRGWPVSVVGWVGYWRCGVVSWGERRGLDTGNVDWQNRPKLDLE